MVLIINLVGLRNFKVSTLRTAKKKSKELDLRPCLKLTVGEQEYVSRNLNDRFEHPADTDTVIKIDVISQNAIIGWAEVDIGAYHDISFKFAREHWYHISSTTYKIEGEIGLKIGWASLAHKNCEVELPKIVKNYQDYELVKLEDIIQESNLVAESILESTEKSKRTRVRS